MTHAFPLKSAGLAKQLLAHALKAPFVRYDFPDQPFQIPHRDTSHAANVASTWR